MPKSHTELVCWQLANDLRQIIIKHTMDDLCGRAMIANLRWLQALERPDP